MQGSAPESQRKELEVESPREGRMGTYGGERWIKLAAQLVREDIYVVDKKELANLQAGHITRPLRQKNPNLQQFKSNGQVVTLNLKEMVAALKKSRCNIMEHNGGSGASGHWAAYSRTRAPVDLIKELVNKHEAARMPDPACVSEAAKGKLAGGRTRRNTANKK